MVKRIVRQFLKMGVIIVLIVAAWYRLDIYEKLANIEFFSYILANFALSIKVLFFIYLASIGLDVFLHNENPTSTLAWLLVFVSAPFLGYIAYLIFGRTFNKKLNLRSKSFMKEINMEKEKLILTDDLNGKNLAKLLYKNSGAPISYYNDTTVYLEGESQFLEMLNDIKQAKDSIHVEYYIIRSDSTGKEFIKVLASKAREGIRVKVIYDDIGSLDLDDSFLNDLIDAGADVGNFLPVYLPRFAKELNYRNHRKILIIDNKIAYMGGMNIGDEYRGRNKYFKFWRDTHLRIEGEAVKYIQKCFIQDWFFVKSKISKSRSKYLGEALLKTDVDYSHLNIQPMQIVASGPDRKWQTINQAYFLMICSAKSHIIITTPYLVPDLAITSALKTAALSGVKVDIVVPSKPDHFFVYWSTRANFETLMEAGVNIHEYTKGFIHSKGIVVDGKICSIGTANFDIRSLKLNFEINSFIYDEYLSGKIEDVFMQDISDSVKIDPVLYKKRPFKNKMLESLGKLVSPLQ